MNCEQVEELLSAYLDNALAIGEPPELASHLRSEITVHLQTCARCSHMLDDFRHFDILLSELPRVRPSPALSDRIFSSPEYLELTGTFDVSGGIAENNPSRSRRDTAGRPRLVALPGGRRSSSTAPTQQKIPAFRPERGLATPTAQRRRSAWILRTMQMAIAATILLTIGIGGLIGWNLWLKQANTAKSNGGITPPANPPSSVPLSAGMHLVFLRDGALWSASADGSTQAVRLTPDTVTVASSWVVSPAGPGRAAGDRLVYIDLQQAFVHTIRSDGLRDTVVQQPLLKAGVQPSTLWDTDLGAAILSSLTWSGDGSMLAFVADPKGTGLTNLYIFSTETGTVQLVPLTTLSIKGSVSHPIWSPDGIRVAFELIHDGVVSIVDYNTQNHGLITITNGVNLSGNSSDTVLAMDWAPSVDMPTITWSVGVPGHVHSIWARRVGVSSTIGPRELATGDYAQAIYSRAGHDGVGSWLLVTSRWGHAGDLWRVDVTSGSLVSLTSGKQISSAQWSPDGTQIDYLDAVSSEVGIFHVVNVSSGLDTLVASGVADEPTPVWSVDSQRLAYSTGIHTVVVDIHASKKLLSLKLRGAASTFVWSVTSPYQLVIALGDGQQGIYLVDSLHNTSLQLDKHGTAGPIAWTEVP